MMKVQSLQISTN